MEGYKYVVKEEKMPEYITADKEFSSDSDRKNSDEEDSNWENQFKIVEYDANFKLFWKYSFTHTVKWASKRSKWNISKYFWRRKRQKPK